MLKSYFPGDSSFSLGNFSELPYGYVIEAVRKGAEIHRRELHEKEVGTALLASIHVNSNRDPKKTPKPYSLYDFCFYHEKTEEASASIRYGSAMLQLVRKGKFPSWALFCYAGLGKNADPNHKPDVLAYQCDDVILLAPVKSELGWTGFMVARESASESMRTLTNEHGDVIRLGIPYIETKVVAREDVTLS